MRSTAMKTLGLSLAAIIALSANPAFARHHHRHYHHHWRHHHWHGPQHKHDGAQRQCPPDDKDCHGGGTRKFP